MKKKPSSRSRRGPRKPIEVKQGSVTVKIYTGTNRVGAKKYPQFWLVYHSPEGRVRRRFADLDKAKREAELAAIKLANQEGQVLTLTAGDRASFIQARDLLEPLGTPLHRAVDDYVQAVKRLPQATSLKETVDFFVRRNPANLPQKSVRQVVDELIEAKDKAGRSDLHLKDLRTRLGRFADAFQTNIGQVTGKLIQEHLDGLGVAGRSRLNHFRLIVTLFNFAVRRKYLAKDALEELAAVEQPDVMPSPTLIFDCVELREMLFAVRGELVPWIAIGAFCGLRTAEILRLDWAQVNLERRFIEVKALNAKTAARRLVPLCEAAVAWLGLHRQSEGRFAHYTEENKLVESVTFDVNQARRTAGHEANFRWKKNALRHSFCSYRLALIQDAGKVALEAGNSPTMIFRHYRELVTEDDAKAWFSVIPTPAANVVGLAATVVS